MRASVEFWGGPADGRTLVVNGEPFEIIIPTSAPVSADLLYDPEVAVLAPAITQHRYRRSRDGRTYRYMGTK